MKKIIIITAALFIITTNTIKAQSFKFGTIAADVGIGGGIYGVKAFSPANQATTNGIIGVGTLPRFNAEFGLLKFLDVGLSYRRGTYGKKGDYKLRGSDVMLRANIHLANKKDGFDLPIGVGYGFSNFGGNISTSQSFNANGGILNIHISPHFYFGKYIGMFLSVGYNKHLFSKVTAIDGVKTYTEADGATWKMGGIYFEFGVAGHFHLFKSKE